MIGIILAFQRTNDDYLQVQKVVNDISVSLECPCLRRFDGVKNRGGFCEAD